MVFIPRASPALFSEKFKTCRRNTEPREKSLPLHRGKYPPSLARKLPVSMFLTGFQNGSFGSGIYAPPNQKGKNFHILFDASTVRFAGRCIDGKNMVLRAARFSPQTEKLSGGFEQAKDCGSLADGIRSHKHRVRATIAGPRPGAGLLAGCRASVLARTCAAPRASHFHVPCVPHLRLQLPFSSSAGRAARQSLQKTPRQRAKIDQREPSPTIASDPRRSARHAVWNRSMSDLPWTRHFTTHILTI